MDLKDQIEKLKAMVLELSLDNLNKEFNSERFTYRKRIRQLENPNFIINFATLIAFLIILMIVFTIYDYIQTMRPFWEIEKRYKKELESLRKNKFDI